MSLPYSYSRSFSKLNTGKASRVERIRRAIGHDCTLLRVENAKQASASIVYLSPALSVLVSYTTIVAYCHDGGYVATPYGEFSKTTDRSVADFAPSGVLRLEVSEFNTRLKALIKG